MLGKSLILVLMELSYILERKGKYNLCLLSAMDCSSSLLWYWGLDVEYVFSITPVGFGAEDGGWSISDL